MILKTFIIFNLMLIFSYVFYRNLANKFQLRIKNKTLQKHIFDISDLILYGSIFYLLVFYNPSHAI